MKSPALLIINLILVGIITNACNGPTEQAEEIDLSNTISIDENTAGNQGANTDHIYYFGFDLRSSPQEDAKQYLPFMDYLTRTTGYTFKLKLTSQNSNIIDDLGTGAVQFASIGATSYITSHQKYGTLTLARGKNQQDKAEYRSALVTLPVSPITRLKDIKQKRLAFGSNSSTQGHLIPRIILQQNNIQLSELQEYTYTGSHLNCANAVIFNHADICGMQDTMADSLQAQGKLKILTYSDYYPSSGIAANKNVNAKVIEKVTRALLAFDPITRHSAGLHNWQLTEMPHGFSPSSDSDYKSLRDWMMKLDVN